MHSAGHQAINLIVGQTIGDGVGFEWQPFGA